LVNARDNVTLNKVDKTGDTAMKFTVRGADHVPYSLLSHNPVQLVKEHNAHGAFLKAMECKRVIMYILEEVILLVNLSLNLIMILIE
jgi:ribonuclease PH